MLKKALALWIVLLAASPLTQPFSTVTFDQLRDNPSAPGWSVRLVRSVAIDNIAPTDVTLNPPVEVRHAGHFQHPAPRTAALSPEEQNPVVSIAGRHDRGDQPARDSGLVCPFSVLRL